MLKTVVQHNSQLTNQIANIPNRQVVPSIAHPHAPILAILQKDNALAPARLTIRPRSPGYIRPEHIAHIVTDLPEPTKTLLARGVISEDVALEQLRASRSDQTETSHEGRSMSNQTQNSWVLQDIAERRKAADREARAARNPTQDQAGPGEFSPSSPEQWKDSAEAVECEQRSSAFDLATPVQQAGEDSIERADPAQHSPAHASGDEHVRKDSNRHRKVWVNPEYSERDNWARIEANLKKSDLIKSPFVPHNYGEHIQHRAIIAEAVVRDDIQKIKIKKAERERPPLLIQPAMMGRTFNDNRGLVTSMETIWSPNWKQSASHPQARWPTPAEMKEEGDERYTSGFDRFLPLPRVPGNETVGHKMRSLVAPYHMDRVRELPTPAYENDIPEPVDENEQRYWLGSDLFEHIERYGDDPETEAGS